MNPDLEEERKNSTVNSRSISLLLYGEDGVNKRDYIIRFVESIPEFKDTKHVAFKSREERYEDSARKMHPMLKYVKALNTTDEELLHHYRSLVFPLVSYPFELHNAMFIPALQSQCTEEQKKKWLIPALNYQIVGTYAQTELGHGTNLKQLETTSTYDVKTQEFIINSPTLTSTKWWPGNLGKSANYAVVVAQLIIKGKNYGVQPFVVQIRDTISHQPLPGITVGDIGPKFGFNSNDNGFLRLDQVRVPRENMLMRFARVEPDGTYVAPANSKLVYGPMIFVRSVMVAGHAYNLGKGVTIAVRYSCVRRQGEKFEGKGETKLLDYQTQQYRLFPELAKVFAFYFGGMHLRKVYQEITDQIQQGNLHMLPELHFLSSGLKAYVTYETARGVEICRLSCGGHGYSQSSNFPELYTFVVGGCTYEGDNIVLFLQVARNLLKIVQQKKKTEFTEYLWKNNSSKESPLDKRLLLEDLLDAYQHVAQRVIFETVKEFNDLIKQGFTIENAWHQRAVAFTKCAKAHVRVFLVKHFISILDTIDDKEMKNLMHILCQLFALHGIYTKRGQFQEDNYISSQQMSFIKQRIFELLPEIRPHAVAIVDGFMYTDRQLNSVLGRYDGNVYANLYKWASESPMNKTDVMDFHHKYLGQLSSFKSKI